MDPYFEFSFRGYLYTCNAYYDFSQSPFFIFIILKAPELIWEFGEEVTIKTDGRKLLPKRDDSIRNIVFLRQAIFDSLKQTDAFIKATAGINHSDESLQATI
jgi:hypothetical protein